MEDFDRSEKGRSQKYGGQGGSPRDKGYKSMKSVSFSICSFVVHSLCIRYTYRSKVSLRATIGFPIVG
jgi:hypothetical protein